MYRTKNLVCRTCTVQYSFQYSTVQYSPYTYIHKDWAYIHSYIRKYINVQKELSTYVVFTVRITNVFFLTLLLQIT